ncbi:MAG: T9SS type A sorting domain-containing protein, partial [Ignavibacteriota bacterium]
QTYTVQKFDASFANSKVGYAVGSTGSFQGHPEYPASGFCQKTTDGGTTWAQLYTGIPAYLHCCKTIDPAMLFVAGAEGFIGRTTNSGVTWDTVIFGRPGLPEFESMDFINAAHGMIVGTGGRVLVTIDSGKNWHQQLIQTTLWLQGIVMLDDSIALVCGGGNIYRTTVGGNFSSVTNHNYNFQLQTFPNPTSSSLTVEYQLPSASTVSFKIYGLQGVLMNNIPIGVQNAGAHHNQIDMSTLPNGTYFLNLTTGPNTQTIPFIVQK